MILMNIAGRQNKPFYGKGGLVEVGKGGEYMHVRSAEKKIYRFPICPMTSKG